MPRAYHDHMDLCPVCRTYYPEPGYLYHSKNCVRIAYNFRKRLLPVLDFLTDLGCVCSFSRGVQLRVVWPDWICRFYPQPVHRFYFPMSAADISTLNAEHVWAAIGSELGESAVTFLRWLCARDDYHGKLLHDLYLTYLRSVLEDSGFTCDQCHHRYIRSNASFEDHGYVCAACVEARIPF